MGTNKSQSIAFITKIKQSFLGNCYRSARQWKKTVPEWKKIIKIYLIALSQHHFSYSFANFKEFAYLYEDIFLLESYKFSTTKKTPIILDCGSHIGLSVLYFTLTYPSARITAFEPNPKTFQFLVKNVRQNSLENVILVNAALAGREGTIPFYIAKNTNGYWSWGDSGVKSHWPTLNFHTTISVPTMTLSSFINQPIDLLKMDIESMELEVLTEIEDKLHFVKQIILEFHGSKRNPIEKLITLLKKHHFSYSIYYYQGQQITEKQIDKTKPYLLIVRAVAKNFQK